MFKAVLINLFLCWEKELMSNNMSEEIEKTKEVPCPDCYGGHFKPCNLCGDSGFALLLIEEKPKTEE